MLLLHLILSTCYLSFTTLYAWSSRTQGIYFKSHVLTSSSRILALSHRIASEWFGFSIPSFLASAFAHNKILCAFSSTVIVFTNKPHKLYDVLQYKIYCKLHYLSYPEITFF